MIKCWRRWLRQQCHQAEPKLRCTVLSRMRVRMIHPRRTRTQNFQTDLQTINPLSCWSKSRIRQWPRYRPSNVRRNPFVLAIAAWMANDPQSSCDHLCGTSQTLVLVSAAMNRRMHDVIDKLACGDVPDLLPREGFEVARLLISHAPVLVIVLQQSDGDHESP